MEVFWSWACIVGAMLCLITSSMVMFFYQESAKQTVPTRIWSWPVIGETFSFLRMGACDFLVDRFSRYGDIFTTSLFGREVVVVSSPEDIKFILTSKGDHSFPRAWPAQLFKLLDEGSLRGPGNTENGSNTHPVFRRTILSITTGESLHNLIPLINSQAQETVETWTRKGVVDNIPDVNKYTFTLSMHILCKEFAANSLDIDFFLKHMSATMEAMFSPMISLPGFTWHRAMKSKEAVLKRLKEIIAPRRENPQVKKNIGDIVGALLQIREFEVSDDDIALIVVGLMFAGFTSTSKVIQMAIEYLLNYPEVQQRVLDEQIEVKKKIAQENSLICWIKHKSLMPYTTQVVDELLRMKTPFLPRRTKTTMNHNGFTFKEDSQVWAAISTLHHNPEYYPNPAAFDPTRFKETPKPFTFLPFGLGPSACVGGELGRLEALFIMHHFVLSSCGTLKLKPNIPCFTDRLVTKMGF